MSSREAYLQRTYGISEDEYLRCLELQGGVCAICRNPPGKKRLVVDHDHRTGEVRGLLCPHRCNYRLLGRQDKDPEIFLRAYQYLTDPPFELVKLERDANIEQPQQKGHKDGE